MDNVKGVDNIPIIGINQRLFETSFFLELAPSLNYS